MTKQPTLKPTNKPTIKPTSKPTFKGSGPTQKPTSRPPSGVLGGVTACASINEIKLNLGNIKKMIDPILGKVVNKNNDGAFDQVAQPLLELDKRLPGISDLAEKKISFLDMAEVYAKRKSSRAQSGVESVRTILSIYRSLKNVINQFDDGSNTISIADECFFRPGQGAKCTGGLTTFTTDDGSRKLLEEAQEMEDVFPTYDYSGQPISPAHRWLAEGCTPKFTGPDCKGRCDGCSTVAKAKCLARKLKCKGKSVKGLTFPFMNDPASLLGLLSGKDIEVFEFSPPPLTWAFDISVPIVLYTPPTVNLVLGFGVSVQLDYSIVFTSRGIREAIQEKNPLKGKSKR